MIRYVDPAFPIPGTVHDGMSKEEYALIIFSAAIIQGTVAHHGKKIDVKSIAEEARNMVEELFNR